MVTLVRVAKHESVVVLIKRQSLGSSHERSACESHFSSGAKKNFFLEMKRKMEEIRAIVWPDIGFWTPDHDWVRIISEPDVQTVRCEVLRTEPRTLELRLLHDVPNFTLPLGTQVKLGNNGVGWSSFDGGMPGVLFGASLSEAELHRAVEELLQPRIGPAASFVLDFLPAIVWRDSSQNTLRKRWRPLN
jgi:hypothetical protein